MCVSVLYVCVCCTSVGVCVHTCAYILAFLVSFDIRSTELVNITKYFATVSAAVGGSIIQENNCDRLTVERVQ